MVLIKGRLGSATKSYKLEKSHLELLDVDGSLKVRNHREAGNFSVDNRSHQLALNL